MIITAGSELTGKEWLQALQQTDGEESETVVHFQSTKTFAYEVSLRHIEQTVRAANMRKDLTDHEISLSLQTMIDFSKKAAIQATGGLLSYVEKKSCLYIEDGCTTFDSIGPIRFDKIMLLDSDAVSSLQIFHKEKHPR